MDKPRTLENVVTFAVLAGASALVGHGYPINDDDIYHLQSLWMTASGYTPYTDFQAGHPPGPWIVLSPWAWTWSHFAASTIVVQARLLVAVGFGLAGVFIGSLIEARTVRLVTLVVLLLLVLAKCMVFLYRIEYLVAPLLWLHVWLLARMDTARRPNLLSFLAALTIGFAGTMSVRVAILLLIQPVFLLVMQFRYHRPWVKTAIACWLAGGLLGALPTLIYLAAHNLWSEAWLWCITYPSTQNEIRWHSPTDLWDLVQIAAAIAAFLLLSREERLPSAARWALGITFILNFLWYLVNPMRWQDYTNIHIYMAWAAILAVVPCTLFHKIGIDIERFNAWPTRRKLIRIILLVGLALLLVGWQLGRTGTWLSERIHRDLATRQMQNQLLDWLQVVSAGESVLLIDPYHPITSPNATFLRSRWPYRMYLRNRIIAPRLENLAERVVDAEPAVVARLPHVDPKFSDLFGYFESRGVVSHSEVEQLRSMIANDYAEVEFTTLSEPVSKLEFGHVFWVRKDRLEASPPPDPHIVRPPFTDASPAPSTP